LGAAGPKENDLIIRRHNPQRRLRQHRMNASQHGQTADQRGQEQQFFNARFYNKFGLNLPYFDYDLI
jgi:hypothetical protein